MRSFQLFLRKEAWAETFVFGRRCRNERLPLSPGCEPTELPQRRRSVLRVLPSPVRKQDNPRWSRDTLQDKAYPKMPALSSPPKSGEETDPRDPSRDDGAQLFRQQKPLPLTEQLSVNHLIRNSLVTLVGSFEGWMFVKKIYTRLRFTDDPCEKNTAPAGAGDQVHYKSALDASLQRKTPRRAVPKPTQRGW